MSTLNKDARPPGQFVHRVRRVGNTTLEIAPKRGRTRFEPDANCQEGAEVPTLVQLTYESQP